MPKKQPEERIEPTLSADKAISLFKEQIDKIDSLTKLHHDDPEYDKWKTFTQQLIIKAFGKPHDNLNSFNNVSWGGVFVDKSDQEWQRDYIRNLSERKALIEGFIEQLEKFGGVEDTQSLTAAPASLSRKVFIVHGHNDTAKAELALIITRLGLEPIILHEQANKGMTVIEKLEANSDVGYAFILLTPDDAGCQKGNEKELKLRARQNVVFEFGMFVGRSGRKRVCCLYNGNIELPSDLQGLVYLPFNTSVNEKQLDIVKELRAAGYEIKI